MKRTLTVLGFLGLGSVIVFGLTNTGRLTAQKIPGLPDQAPVWVDQSPPLKPFSPAPNLLKTSLDDMDFEKLNRIQQEISDRFVTLDYATHQASFDIKAAREAGYDPEVIKLVQEAFDSQNELVKDLKAGRATLGNSDPDPVKYPRWRKFQDRATERIHKMKSEKSLR